MSYNLLPPTYNEAEEFVTNFRDFSGTGRIMFTIENEGKYHDKILFGLTKEIYMESL